MEFWWWVEPLCKTGLLTLTIAVFLIAVFSDSDLAETIAAILLIPFMLAAVSLIVWIICALFWWIWGPYFG